jgi:dTDP-4-amino-4,6-dideoxygalactose transaminase
LVLNSAEELQSLKNYLAAQGVDSLTHYRCLHKSSYFKDKYEGKQLLNAEKFENRLLRLPLHSDVPMEYVASRISDFFKSK